MGTTLVSQNRIFYGLSSDTKPAAHTIPGEGGEGALFYETNTGTVYAFVGGSWVTVAPNTPALSIVAGVVAAEVTFTETAGAGTYTGSVAVPAGATLLDVIVNGVALWDNDGAVTMKVGDGSDDDGYFTGVNLKATDLLAGESISFAQAGGKAGAYIANNQVSPRYAAGARTISGIVTAASTNGSAGRTRMVVVYALTTPSAATKA